MINISDITTAIKEMVEADQDFEGFYISRGEYINDDQSIDKWLGIYKSEVSYNTRTLGSGINSKPWLTSVQIKIIAQAFGIDGDEIENLLDERVRDVLDMLEADRTLKGTVNMINSYNIQYSYDGKEYTGFPFQNAMITINAEVRA